MDVCGSLVQSGYHFLHFLSFLMNSRQVFLEFQCDVNFVFLEELSVVMEDFRDRLDEELIEDGIYFSRSFLGLHNPLLLGQEAFLEVLVDFVIVF